LGSCREYNFRVEYKLSPIEFCAFLYDYAPQYLEKNRDCNLPEPLRVWLIKGSNGGKMDFEYLEKSTSESRSYWNGNIKTKRGDILIMYCVSPYSCIHSIWRANSDGFTDPFFYYHNRVEISNRILLPKITFKELQQLPIISKKPEMKAHLQTNTGGIEFSFQEYEELLKLVAEKDFNTQILRTFSD